MNDHVFSHERWRYRPRNAQSSKIGAWHRDKANCTLPPSATTCCSVNHCAIAIDEAETRKGFISQRKTVGRQAARQL